MTGFGRRYATVLVAFAFALMIGLSHPARADLMIMLSDANSGSSATIDVTTGNVVTSSFVAGTGFGAPSALITTTAPPPAGTIWSINYNPTGGFGNFSMVSLTVTSNSPTGFAGLGTVRDIQLDTANTGVATDSLTLKVWSQGFTIGAGNNGTLTNTLASSSLGSSATDTAAFQSFVGTGEGAGFVATGMTSSVSLTGPVPLLGSSTGSQANVSLSSPSYTVANTMTMTLGAGETGQITGTTQISAVPEPATLISACVGMGLSFAAVSFNRFRRRRPLA